jgi:hypothetical protein
MSTAFGHEKFDGAATIAKRDLAMQVEMLRRLLTLGVIEYSKVTQLFQVVKQSLDVKRSEQPASSPVVADKLVRRNPVGEMTQHERVEFFRNKIIFPKDKEKQPFLVFYISSVRTASNAAFLAAIASGKFEALFYQADKFFERGLNQPGDQIILPELPAKQHLEYFFKFTLGPKSWELNDPVKLFTDLGYDPSKISIISGIRKPTDTFLSIQRLEVDKLSVSEFDKMYSYLANLLTNYNLNFKLQKRVALVFEFLEEMREDQMPQLMEKMFGKKFDPVFPTLEELKKMDHVYWLEATNSEYFDKFIMPVLNEGRFKYSSATLTDPRKLFAKDQELFNQAQEVQSLLGLVYDTLAQFGELSMFDDV